MLLPFFFVGCWFLVRMRVFRRSFVALVAVLGVGRPACVRAAAVAVQAQQGLSAGELTAAMVRFEEALRADPTDRAAQAGEREAAVALALHQRNAGEADAALATLERARKALPGDGTILLDLGIQAESMHHLVRAAEVLEQLVRQEPDNARALYALGRVEVDQQRFTEAEAHLSRYLVQQPGDASAHYGLGRVYQMQQQTAKAAAEFETSVRLKPVQTESYYQLGQMSLEAGDDVAARTNFARTLERLPTHGGALTGMGMLLYRTKAYADARGYLVKAVAAAPDYQPAHYYLGLTDGKLGDKAESDRELAVALRLAEAQQGKGKAVVQQ